MALLARGTPMLANPYMDPSLPATDARTHPTVVEAISGFHPALEGEPHRLGLSPTQAYPKRDRRHWARTRATAT